MMSALIFMHEYCGGTNSLKPTTNDSFEKIGVFDRYLLRGSWLEEYFFILFVDEDAHYV